MNPIHISNKYKVQREPLHLKWYRFIPTLKKKFPHIISEMLSCNSQQQLLNSNETDPCGIKTRNNTITFGKEETTELIQ